MPFVFSFFRQLILGQFVLKLIGHYVLFYNLFGDEMKLRIKDLREDNDLTQKEVAKVLMCDQSLYSKYERGEREIPLSLLIKLADCYGTSLDYLTCRTDNPSIK
jgi:DNA-binding XRE family transcriptional regulator